MTNEQHKKLHRLSRNVSDMSKLTMLFLPDVELVHILALWSYIRRAKSQRDARIEIERAIMDAYSERLEGSYD